MLNKGIVGRTLSDHADHSQVCNELDLFFEASFGLSQLLDSSVDAFTLQHLFRYLTLDPPDHLLFCLFDSDPQRLKVLQSFIIEKLTFLRLS